MVSLQSLNRLIAAAAVSVIVLFNGGCTKQELQVSSKPVPPAPKAAMTLRTWQGEVTAAEVAFNNNDYVDAQANLDEALILCASDNSAKLKILSLKATIYESTNEYVEAEAAWRQCAELTMLDSGKMANESIKYLHCEQRLLKRIGKQVEANAIEDRIGAFRFDEENPDNQKSSVNAQKRTNSVDALPAALLCPRCGASGTSVPVIYGKPTDALLAQELCGKIRLGGDVPPQEHHWCNKCRNAW